RHAAAGVHRVARLQRPPAVRRLQAGRDAEGDEVRERLRRQADPRLHPAGEQRASGGDHPADFRDRGRRRRPRLGEVNDKKRETMATATKKAKASEAAAAGGVGRIARVTGPVVDIEFPHDAIPEIYNALQTDITIGDETTTITLEVAQHLGDDLVRAIALKP